MFPPVALYVSTLAPFISRVILPAGKIHRALGGEGGIVSGGFGGLRELLWMFLVPPVPEPGAGSPETYNYVFVWCFSNLLGLRKTFYGLVGVRKSHLQAFRAPRIEFPEVLGPENPFNRVLGSTSKLLGSQNCLSNLFNLSELLK